MNKEIFESIYRESKKDEDYEQLSYLFNKWNSLRTQTSEAYDYAKSFSDGDNFMDAQKVHGYRAAKNFQDESWHRYAYLKAERERTKKEFDELLSNCPDFNTDDANKLCNNELAKYIDNLDKKGIRKNTVGIEQDESLPHINQNITVEVTSQKLSTIKDLNGKQGAFVNITGKDGLNYSFWLFTENNSDLFTDNHDIESVSGTVKKVNDFHGTPQIMLTKVSIKYVDINMSEKEFDEFYTSLNPKPIEVENTKELPKGSKIYKTCIKDYQAGYIFGAIVKLLYKYNNSYYYINKSWRDTVD